MTASWRRASAADRGRRSSVHAADPAGGGEGAPGGDDPVRQPYRPERRLFRRPRAIPTARPFRRAVEEGLIDPKRYVHDRHPGHGLWARGLGFCRRRTASGSSRSPSSTRGGRGRDGRGARDRGARADYVTYDIDFVDPTFAPGTGTPEVGGPNSWQALQVARGLRGLDVVGADLVEVSPPFDASRAGRPGWGVADVRDAVRDGRAGCAGLRRTGALAPGPPGYLCRRKDDDDAAEMIVTNAQGPDDGRGAPAGRGGGAWRAGGFWRSGARAEVEALAGPAMPGGRCRGADAAAGVCRKPSASGAGRGRAGAVCSWAGCRGSRRWRRRSAPMRRRTRTCRC